MPYFIKEIVYGCIVSIVWSPSKDRTPQNLTINNFGHPVSKAWLRPWLGKFHYFGQGPAYTCFKNMRLWRRFLLYSLSLGSLSSGLLQINNSTYFLHTQNADDLAFS